MDINKLYELIENEEVICIFTHVNADSDALGSQLSLKLFLQNKYPNKKIYALGKNNPSFLLDICKLDLVDDSVINNSIGIIVDCSSKDRVEDQRFESCSKLVKIDHHPMSDLYTELDYVNVDAGATCEIVSLMLKKNKEVIDKDIATLLYSGLLSDTIRFSIKSTSKYTFEAASYLLEYDIDLSYINEKIYSKTIDDFNYINYVRSNGIVVNESLMYAIVEKEEYEKFNLTFQEAKSKVYVFSEIIGIEIWVLIVRNPDNNLYAGSIRSKNATINDIAANFNGGGHKLASGIRDLTRDDIDILIQQLCNKL